MAWVGREDALGALYHAIVDTRWRGPINVVAPEAVTNAQFAAELGQVLRRPAVLPVPALALQAIFGAMADETLLASTRAEPRALAKLGYRFRHATLAAALRHEVGRLESGS
jgi:NAD dependent epimerase/dehydratase family enzyme